MNNRILILGVVGVALVVALAVSLFPSAERTLQVAGEISIDGRDLLATEVWRAKVSTRFGLETSHGIYPARNLYGEELEGDALVFDLSDREHLLWHPGAQVIDCIFDMGVTGDVAYLVDALKVLEGECPRSLRGIFTYIREGSGPPEIEEFGLRKDGTSFGKGGAKVPDTVKRLLERGLKIESFTVSPATGPVPHRIFERIPVLKTIPSQPERYSRSS